MDYKLRKKREITSEFTTVGIPTAPPALAERGESTHCGVMLPSVLTAFLFAASGVCGRRAAMAYGPLRANAIRLSLASAVLGLWTWTRSPVNFTTRSVEWLFYSGAVGFGLGDMGLFLAYPRLGARLAILVNLCSAPLVGALLDRLWLGVSLRPSQTLAGLAILGGVSMALSSRQRRGTSRHEGDNDKQPLRVPAGLAFALLAGFGQGCGATLSRRAHAVAVEDGTILNGVSQAFVRTIPGVAFALLAWAAFCLHSSRSRRGSAASRGYECEPGSLPWLLGAAMFGPVLGVSCFQWALSGASSALVLAVTATAPIIIMPLAAYIEDDRPGWPAVAGAVIAVVGVAWLALTAA